MNDLRERIALRLWEDVYADPADARAEWDDDELRDHREACERTADAALAALGLDDVDAAIERAAGRLAEDDFEDMGFDRRLDFTEQARRVLEAALAVADDRVVSVNEQQRGAGGTTRPQRLACSQKPDQ